MTSAATILAAALVTGWVLWPILRAPRGGVAADAGSSASARASTGGVRTCPNCGPRPEGDARYCSNCGTAIVGQVG